MAELLDRCGLLLEDEDARRDAIYVRVSSHEQKNRGDLDRQVSDIMMACEKEGLDRPIIIRDTGSGLNAKRKGLLRLIEMAKNHEVKRIFITNKDRLTRFGYEYLEELFSMADVKLIALQEKEDKDLQEELVDDMMSLLASFSGKLYRIRGNQKKKMREIIDSMPDQEDE
ncbi:IS607 family transposase [Faecalibaculum rodentium]|uniref:DNA binding domain excisionase family n=1 Tax=Faecalibaculum rodentium TaxID=1702221 RepID=A0A140DXJ1_9FIRM|nr:IS607 family transposase [Faecalibaculum rodentium]AMK55368.1 dNA binding domain excisionase family [Faecalibaculum rodentium]